ncbi:MAG: helix-turn-helix domain-containing protein, partial [Methanocorpusculum sp.]|nr:helix-turn-helix domain-containing protein [Methanocorpusculum sp.]
MPPANFTLGYEIKSLSNHLKRNICQTAATQSDCPVTGTHGMIIDYLAHAEGSIYQRDIEAKFSMRRSTVSGILDIMVKNGLITRERVESDARL